MLEERIRSKEDIRIAVIGVGYVGLPLAVKLAEADFLVFGVEINPDVVSQLHDGKSTVEMVSDEQVEDVVNVSKKFIPILVTRSDSAENESAAKQLAGADIYIVCVPTPLHLSKGAEPDIQWIEGAAEVIRRVARIEVSTGQLPKERLVILESTTYPGTTRDIFVPIFDEFKKEDISWYLAYSPERTNPGKSSKNGYGSDPFDIPRIVGAIDPPSQRCAVALYEEIFDSVYKVDNLETAEMIKLVENTFRFISIAFANEMARVAKIFGLNIWDILKAAQTKGFGLDLCYPGLIGGHCIPIDPHYLAWAVRNRRQSVTIVDAAEKAHQDIKRDAMDVILRMLNNRGRSISKSSILFLGVTYKKNIGDIRESAALDLMKKLYAYGSNIFFWDPIRANHGHKPALRLPLTADELGLIPLQNPNREHKGTKDNHSFVPEELSGLWEDLRQRILSDEFHCIVIASDHDIFHSAYRDLILEEDAPPIADLRNAISFWIETSLKEGQMIENEAEELRQKINNRDKYILLGVH